MATRIKRKRLSGLDKRLQGRERCKVIYTYFRPINRLYIVREAKKRHVTYSQFVDEIITDLRTKRRAYRQQPGKLKATTARA